MLNLVLKPYRIGLWKWKALQTDTAGYANFGFEITVWEDQESEVQ